MARWHALLAAVALLAGAAGQDLNRDFDPCQTGQVATVGQAYVLGLAYLPGGEPDAWFNGVDANGLPVVRHPCDPGDRAALGGALSVAAYSLDVEGLALLRADSGPLLGDALASEAGVLSVVAYNGDFVSAPRLIVSNSTQLTGNAGIVTSLNLVLNAQRGENVVASWDSRGCGTCQVPPWAGARIPTAPARPTITATAPHTALRCPSAARREGHWLLACRDRGSSGPSGVS